MLSGRAKKIRMGEKHGIHQLLVCADDINVGGKQVYCKKKKKKAVLEAGKEVGLEINTDKTKYIVVSHHRNGGQTIY